jgi:hypothetical protein
MLSSGFPYAACAKCAARDMQVRMGRILRRVETHGGPELVATSGGNRFPDPETEFIER